MLAFIPRTQARQGSLDSNLRGIFETSPIPMWIYNRRTLQFVAVNDAVTRAYGYSAEEFRSMSILEIRPREEAERLGKLLRSRGRHPQAEGVWWHRRKNGTVFPVDII